jgi:hypothetical protein
VTILPGGGPHILCELLDSFYVLEDAHGQGRRRRGRRAARRPPACRRASIRSPTGAPGLCASST